MLLAVDCGNTQVVLGVFDQDKLLASWRMSTNARRTADEYMVFLKDFLHSQNIHFSDIDGMIVGSGTHKELLDTCKVYQEIVASQFEKGELA